MLKVRLGKLISVVIVLSLCLSIVYGCNVDPYEKTSKRVEKLMESDPELRAQAEFFVDFAIKRRPLSEKNKLWVENGLIDIVKEMTETFVSITTLETISRMNAQNKWTNAMDYERWELTSFDGLKLIADVGMQKEYSNKWVIAVHGYTSDKAETAKTTYEFYHNGYNIMTPDLRAHGESEGEWITMGYYDSVDLLDWIDKIIELDADAEIILHGVSMGGTTVMVASGHDLPDNVKVIIEESGFSSAWSQFEYILNRFFELDAYPYLYASDIVAQEWADYSFYEASAVKQVAKSTTPILFIHGGSDTFVLTECVNEVYEAANCEKDLLVIPPAGHGMAAMGDYEGYWNKVWEFIGNYID